MGRRREHNQQGYENEHSGQPRPSGIRQLAGLLAVAFVVTLGVLVGTRMSSDAIAVLVGVIAGVAASIPCALLLLAVTRRDQPEVEEPYPAPYREPRHAAPPVIVVTPGNASPQQFLPWASTQSASPYAAYGDAQPQSQRQFRVMGYDADQSADGVDNWPR